MKNLFLLLCIAFAVSACNDEAPVSESRQPMTSKQQEDLKKLSEPYKGTIPPVTRKNLDVFPQK